MFYLWGCIGNFARPDSHFDGRLPHSKNLGLGLLRMLDRADPLASLERIAEDLLQCDQAKSKCVGGDQAGLPGPDVFLAPSLCMRLEPDTAVRAVMSASSRQSTRRWARRVSALSWAALD